MDASGLKEVIPYVVNFSIVVVLLTILGRKPFRKFIYQRHERLKDFVEDSAKVYKAAKARHGTISEKLNGIDAEEKEIIAAEVVSARREADELIAKSGAEAERMKAEAERLIAVETGEIESRVKAEFLDRVLETVEGRLKESLKSEDHKKILKQAQSRIEVGA